MSIGLSIFLLALGAILWLAVTTEVEGVDLDVVGLILVIVGAASLLRTLLASTVAAGRRRVAGVGRRHRPREEA